MKRMIALALSAVFAVLAVLAAVPAAADFEAQYSTPAGYNENDYQKLVAFLELKDGSGVKNGKKLSSSYSPTSPSTWSGISWSSSRVSYIDVRSKGLVGQLDLSGCTYLDSLDCGDNSITSISVSNCTALRSLGCYDNRLTSLNTSGCYYLETVYCGGNQLTSINLSDSPDLYQLSCMENKLTSLDLSKNTELAWLFCEDNQLTSLNLKKCPRLELFSCENNKLKSLDLTGNPMIPFDKLTADGSGYVSVMYKFGSDGYCCIAEPGAGSDFFGWYTENGSLLSGSMELSSTSNKRVVALFTGCSMTIRGDANKDGKIDTTDALLVLRAALKITGNAGTLISTCDMDGNGKIDTTDALLILRLALHIG